MSPRRDSAVVVGLGSIGSRHARILGEMGLEVGVVSRRGGVRTYPGVAEALAALNPGYVVVATETADHGRVLAELAALDFTGRVLVEKPLLADPAPLPVHRFAALGVAYDLRFHPALQRLRRDLAEEQVLTAQIYVGQYLPDWRPGRDYRRLYSSHRAQGGGMLRDLSHELDYAQWLFGPWERVAALGGHWSPLEMDADDAFLLLVRFAGGAAATLQVNGLDRRTRRDAVINTARHTFVLDFIAGTLARDGESPEAFVLERDQMYRDQHRAMLAGSAIPCTVLEAADTLALIAAAEQAAAHGVWVGR